MAGRNPFEGENVIFFQSPPGVGKTHLAIALGPTRVERGQRLLFLSAMELVWCMETRLVEPLPPLAPCAVIRFSPRIKDARGGVKAGAGWR
jgi:hypothetical protein